jgi:hypothetical protein
MAGQGRDHALDHVVVVVFENRSLDNVLGRLYGPGDGKTFDGVTGKDLTNPIPEWAEHGADHKVVPYTVATDMDSPNPDTGEEYPHTNTQLYNILSEANRFKLGEEISAPYNAPAPGQEPCRTRARCPPTSRTHSASARPYPLSAKLFSTGYAHTPSKTTSRSRDYPPTPKPKSLQSRHSTSSTTSSPSNSPCCAPPPRVPPQPDR